MSWPLRRVECLTPYPELQPGDWYSQPIAEQADDDDLSPELRASGRRELIWIRLPGTCGLWSPDLNAAGSASAWTLCLAADGSPLTANPSVNAEGCYHGWLRDGVLTDDCEGRTFP